MPPPCLPINSGAVMFFKWRPQLDTGRRVSLNYGEDLPMPCPTPLARLECGGGDGGKQKEGTKEWGGGAAQEQKAKQGALLQQSCAICELCAPDTKTSPVLHVGREAQ